MAGVPEQEDGGEDVGQVVNDVVEAPTIEPGKSFADAEAACQPAIGAIDKQGGQRQPESLHDVTMYSCQHNQESQDCTTGCIAMDCKATCFEPPVGWYFSQW